MILFPVTLSYPKIVKTTLYTTFSMVFHTLVVDGDRDFKFGKQVDRSKCEPMDDKPFLNGAWSCHVVRLNHLIVLQFQSYVINDWSCQSLVKEADGVKSEHPHHWGGSLSYFRSLETDGNLSWWHPSMVPASGSGSIRCTNRRSV